MELTPNSTVVIKIGTDLVHNKTDGNIDWRPMIRLIEQIMKIKRTVHRVFLVSSGAVAEGRHKYQVEKQKNESIADKQKFASAGQIPLMEMYARELLSYNCVANQILVTTENFRSQEAFAVLRQTLEAIFADKQEGLPIINENDATANDELRFGDNDELTRRLAIAVKADLVVLLTSIDGLLEDIHDPASIVHEVQSDEWKMHTVDATSPNGTGSMYSKCNNAAILARHGIPTHIANGRTENVLTRLVLNEEKGLGTAFIPHKVMHQKMLFDKEKELEPAI